MSRPFAAQTTTGLDHAVFTSIRSPMGEGYRIIAASGAIRPEERMELTRRAPSHGSLIEDDAIARGIVGFPLSTGRYCVGFVRHAGKEHTARGGLRVHTHFVLLDRARFADFACDPWLVACAIADADADDPLLKAIPSLPPIDLRSRSAALPGISSLMPAVEIACYESILEAALAGSPRLVNAAALSEDGARLAWRFIPRVMREKRSMSFGVSYSPARGIDLSFVTDRLVEAQRAALAANAKWIDPSVELTAPCPIATPAAVAPYAEWTALVHRILTSGCIHDLVRLSDLIDADATPEGLATCARLCEHLDQIADADADLLARLTARYAGFAPTCGAQKTLVDRLRKAAAHRSTQLFSGDCRPDDTIAP